MNILFFLTPKNDVAFIYSDANLREAIDLMEAHGYSALPILTKQGRYAGTLTEGDLLWYMKSHLNQSLKDMDFFRPSHKFLSFSSSIIFCRPVILIPSQKKVVRNDESGKERQHPVLDP